MVLFVESLPNGLMVGARVPHARQTRNHETNQRAKLFIRRGRKARLKKGAA